MDVFKHAKIARWRHCNADSLKTLKTNYMLIRLLCVYRMTKCVGKILLWNSKRLLRKLQKNLRELLFCRTLYLYLCGEWNKYLSRIIWWHSRLCRGGTVPGVPLPRGTLFSSSWLGYCIVHPCFRYY